MKNSDLELLKDKAAELGPDVRLSYLEKDYYAVHLVKCLQAFVVEDGSFIFTGGTALAKAYKLLGRFSEDCDFIFLKEKASRKDLSNIRKAIQVQLNQGGFRVKNCESKNKNKNWLFEIEYDRLSPLIKGDSLRTELKLEIVHKDTIKITELPIRPIQSFLAEAKKNPAEIEGITCLSIAEICAGKLSALIWRYLLEEDRDRQPQQIRHLYDIALLLPDLLDSSFNDIVCDVIIEDFEERRKAPIKISEIKEKIWEELNVNMIHKKNYQTYVENYIYGTFNNHLSFEEAVDRLKTLVESIPVDLAPLS